MKQEHCLAAPVKAAARAEVGILAALPRLLFAGQAERVMSALMIGRRKLRQLLSGIGRAGISTVNYIG